MDELNFRRRLYADPNDSAQEISNACASDPAKARFKSEIQQLDEQIKNVLEVPVPDNLAERIFLGQSLAIQRAEKKKHRVHLAIAAGFAFAIGISLQLGGVSPRFDSISDHALAHMTEEMTHIPSSADYTLGQLNAKLASFGGHIDAPIAPIKFANFCDFDGTRSLHLVLAGTQGDVTVFVVPSDAKLAIRKHFSSLDFNGETIVAQSANVVIITKKDNENLGDWSNKINKAIKWQTI